MVEQGAGAGDASLAVVTSTTAEDHRSLQDQGTTLDNDIRFDFKRNAPTSAPRTFLCVTETFNPDATAKTNGRIEQPTSVSLCNTPKPYPGTHGTGTQYKYLVLGPYGGQDMNTCVTITWNSGTCTLAPRPSRTRTYITVSPSIYSSINPSNQAANYLADPGVITEASQWSFKLQLLNWLSKNQEGDPNNNPSALGCMFNFCIDFVPE